MNKNKVLLGDARKVLKTLPDNSVDSIVTDPPYELGFMGKAWDNTGIAYNVELWKQCLRVLKPGGHLLAFGGTRTYHRMAVAIEDAGFEIRDMIEWVYGSGFPKSLNIGKAVDKLQGNEGEITNQKTYPDIRSGNYSNSQGKTRLSGGDYSAVNKEYEGWGTALKPAHETICVAQKSFQSSSDFDNLFVSLLKQLKYQSCQYQSFARIAEQNLRLNQKGQSEGLNIAQWLAEKNINTREDLFVLMATLQSASTENTNWNTVLSWLNILADLYALRNTHITSTELNMTTELSILNSLEWESIFQNITQAPNNKSDGSNATVYIVDNILSVVGLKLKDIHTRFVQERVTSEENSLNFVPNHEPICMARKPISEKTVAQNCLKWGTGGINIDESRVGTDTITQHGRKAKDGGGWETHWHNDLEKGKQWEGRFPANLIHDNSEEVRECFPETKSGKAVIGTGTIDCQNNGIYGSGKGGIITSCFADSGNASRFFKSIIYQPKASKSERNKGCEELEGEVRFASESGSGKMMPTKLDKPHKIKGNYHPTVKPVALMQYLIKMVTPKGGTVLDPFAGSGTTGVACEEAGFGYILIEMEEEHLEIINARLKAYNNKPETVQVKQSQLTINFDHE